MLFEFHALGRVDGSVVTFDADRHPGSESGIVATVLIDPERDRELVAHPDSVNKAAVDVPPFRRVPDLFGKFSQGHTGTDKLKQTLQVREGSRIGMPLNICRTA